jgi:hypothetical protein
MNNMNKHGCVHHSDAGRCYTSISKKTKNYNFRIAHTLQGSTNQRLFIKEKFV